MLQLYLACRDCLCRLPLEATGRSEIGQLLVDSGGSLAEVKSLLPDHPSLDKFEEHHGSHKVELAGEDDTLGYRGDILVLPPVSKLKELMSSDSKDERLQAATLAQSSPECSLALSNVVLKDRSTEVQEQAARSLAQLESFEKLLDTEEVADNLLGRLEKKQPPPALAQVLTLLFQRLPELGAKASERLQKSLEKNPSATLAALQAVPLAELVPIVEAYLPDQAACTTLCSWARSGVSVQCLDLEKIHSGLEQASLGRRNQWLELLAHSGSEGRQKLLELWLTGEPGETWNCRYQWERAVCKIEQPMLELEEVEESGTTEIEVKSANWSFERLETESWVSAVCFSPKGDQLALGTANGDVQLFAPDGGSRNWNGHSGPVSCLAFSWDGELLVSGGWDGNVVCRNLTAGTDEQRQVHRGMVAGAGFVDDRRFYSADPRRIAIWGTRPLRPAAESHTYTQQIHQVVISPEKFWLLSLEDGQAQLYDASTAERVSRLFAPVAAGSLRALTCGSFSPDGNSAAGGQINGKICLWEGLEPQATRDWEAHFGGVRDMVWGDSIVTVGRDQRLRFWTEQGELLEDKELPNQGLALALHPNGKLLAVGHSGPGISLIPLG